VQREFYRKNEDVASGKNFMKKISNPCPGEIVKNTSHGVNSSNPQKSQGLYTPPARPAVWDF
jgi:hypothetical protein